MCSLHSIKLIAKMVISRHILVLDTFILLSPTYITLHKYECIYHKNMSRYIHISEEYYRSEEVVTMDRGSI
jgi:hypothetical protein